VKRPTIEIIYMAGQEVFLGDVLEVNNSFSS
jgi:hypothetical protein